ncbi:hypothetical protein MesoLjLc_38930 [Mesorhizobium sp. L-8-10]|uniref:hypothetical protein n=1 Tax=unclassified Mesorhizobium TaxID=325217 RepID=UPI001928EE24|nr:MULTISPECIES: hypothetical protein [unclassified Mesorhizobium]BCH24229.1 hypothetical protein MesoLjLb_40140 [Mesorhizobium sp. L-8-3]BCH31963.1 hypothetical protein MesoLjLc_38930 [Mesorhizobium sp. L-8-10]
MLPNLRYSGIHLGLQSNHATDHKIAIRASRQDLTPFVWFDLGEIVDSGDTNQILLAPRIERCQHLVTGHYG